jgi:hypothetical protein
MNALVLLITVFIKVRTEQSMAAMAEIIVPDSRRWDCHL